MKELPVAGGGAAAVQPKQPPASPSVLLPHHSDPAAAAASSDSEWSPRAAAIKAAFVHAYSKYEAKCFGQDEYRPLSGNCYNWIGAGLTIIGTATDCSSAQQQQSGAQPAAAHRPVPPLLSDALPTMHVMGLTAEYGRAVSWLAGLRFDSSLMTSFFETTIRVLGGLVSAFDLTGDAVLLEKAKLLGGKLLPAFNTPTGIPLAQVNLATGQTAALSWTGGSSLLAELGTCQMEFFSLSQRSGDGRFATASQKPIDVIERSRPSIPGLYPIYISPSHGGFTNSRIAWGAMGDSFYEYLLKWSDRRTAEQRSSCPAAAPPSRLPHAARLLLRALLQSVHKHVTVQSRRQRAVRGCTAALHGGLSGSHCPFVLGTAPLLPAPSSSPFHTAAVAECPCLPACVLLSCSGHTAAQQAIMAMSRALPLQLRPLSLTVSAAAADCLSRGMRPRAQARQWSGHGGLSAPDCLHCALCAVLCCAVLCCAADRCTC